LFWAAVELLKDKREMTKTANGVYQLRLMRITNVPRFTLNPSEVSLAIGKGGYNIKLASQLTGYEIDVYRESVTEDEEDVNIDEFTDEIDEWIIDVLKGIGCDTAKSVLEIPFDERRNACRGRSCSSNMKASAVRTPLSTTSKQQMPAICAVRCARRTTMMTRPVVTMEPDLFKKVIDQLKPFSSEQLGRWDEFVLKRYGIRKDDMSENHYFLYVIPRVIVLHGYGDPLLDKNMPQYVKWMTEKGLESYFSCNPANINMERTIETFETGWGMSSIPLKVWMTSGIRKSAARRPISPNLIRTSSSCWTSRRSVITNPDRDHDDQPQ